MQEAIAAYIYLKLKAKASPGVSMQQRRRAEQAFYEEHAHGGLGARVVAAVSAVAVRLRTIPRRRWPAAVTPRQGTADADSGIGSRVVDCR